MLLIAWRRRRWWHCVPGCCHRWTLSTVFHKKVDEKFKLLPFSLCAATKSGILQRRMPLYGKKRYENALMESAKHLICSEARLGDLQNFIFCGAFPIHAHLLFFLIWGFPPRSSVVRQTLLQNAASFSIRIRRNRRQAKGRALKFVRLPQGLVSLCRAYLLQTLLNLVSFLNTGLIIRN